MTFSRSFLAGLASRVLLLILTSFGFVYSLGVEGLGAARVLAGLICIGAMVGLWRYVQRTNLELARFVDAVRFGDLSQSFTHRREGSGFGEFGDALEQGIRRLREERHRLSDDNRFYEAVLDDAPTALLTVDGEGRVELANKAARRLLVRHQGIRIEDFREYGTAFAKALVEVSVDTPKLVPVTLDTVPQAAMVSAAVVHRLGGSVRVVAVQPIESELNAVELAAQSDIVRVLTHEIMNSMTPVTSLAHTAADLMAEADKGDPAVADARAPRKRLHRRAPVVRRRLFEVLPWAQELESLFRATDAGNSVVLTLEVQPQTLTIDVDPDLMCQVLLNLLKNGAEAAASHATEPALSLRFTRTRTGRTQIEVGDNGPGVPESLQQDVFLPFFTTKAKGTGVGLSLARQVVLAHRGTISLDRSRAGGAQFRIVI